MAEKIRASIEQAALRVRPPSPQETPEFRAAGQENHHIVLGPGEKVLGEYAAAGLELPDLAALRDYRVQRVRDQIRARDLAGVLVMDPMNIRYLTDTTNMQIWVMHNAARYAWIAADGPIIVWDFYGCEFMAGHNPHVTEVRPAHGGTFFLGGHRQEEHRRKWAAEIIDVIRETGVGRERVAIDQCHFTGYKMIEAAGYEIVSGQEVMEMARLIKGPDEIKAMKCAMNSCENTMQEMHAALEPGMTERELWAMLHAGNIRRGGEWIETQIIASGPRTNPWMQEASSRKMQAGELVGYDTDLVGAYGMMVDISRTWTVGNTAPSSAQQHVHGLALDVVMQNMELLTPGREFGDLAHQTFIPDTDAYRHYCVQYHGVGQCDEYPEIVFPDSWAEWGVIGALEPGMVLTVESYVGAYAGGEGCKLEMQVLITEDGHERLDTYSLALTG